MGKYEGVSCPICHQPIENGEPVAICPECGAPYHRACVEKEGTCVYQDLHAAHRMWEAPKKKEETYTNADAPNRCSRCGSLNPPQGLFCEVCGNPLRPASRQRPEDPVRDGRTTYHGNAGINIGQDAPGGRGYQAPPQQQMAYNPFTTPFGGVNPDDSIGDVPVRDVAIYVGQNSAYFIPKFKQFSDNKSWVSFNFAAMFFHGFYFLYRKMYLWGVLFLLLMLALDAPSILLGIDTARQMLDPNAAAWFNTEQLLAMSNTLSMGTLLVRLAAGLLANRMYMGKALRSIAAIREQHEGDHDAYVAQLTKKGSVSAKLILIFLGVYFLLMFALSFVLLWMNMGDFNSLLGG